jgi:Family of unknown function (DUF5719)
MRRRYLVIAITLILALGLSMSLGLFGVPALADTWTQLNTDGFGDTTNTASTAIAVGPASSLNVCVGTRNVVKGCQVWLYYNTTDTWAKISPSDGFGDKNNTEITSIVLDSANQPRYFGTRNTVTGCELWERKSTTSWRQIGSNGFGDNDNTEISSMYNDAGNYRLFVGTRNSTDGCEVYKVNYQPATPILTRLAGQGGVGVYGYGFGNPNNKAASAMMKGYGGNFRLFVGTRNSSTGCQIWEGGGSPWGWTRVANNGIGDADNTEVTSLTRLNSSGIYAGTENKDDGGQVWRSYETGGTPFSDWAQINTSGFGTKNNSAAFSMSRVVNSTTNNDLCVGTYNDSTGCEIWLRSGGSWSKIGNHGFRSAANFCAYGVYMTTQAGVRQIRVATGSGAAGGARVWDNYAEGSSAWGFTTYISIENPNNSDTTATITYQTENGPVSGGTVPLPANSQTTVNPETVVPNQDFSTFVVSDQGKDIAVDRTMEWTGTGAPSPEGHSSIGVTSPATTWYLPEGSSGFGFECWLLIQNPGDTDANCSVTYMKEGAGPQTVEHVVPANSRDTFNMKDDIGEWNASIKVEADVPVIPERAMYRNSKREGHDSIGTTTPALNYYLAEGSTAWGFTTWVLIQNPNSSAANVTVTYMTSTGPEEQPAFRLPANSRKTIKVNDPLPNKDFSTKVHADKPIIAERSMFWGDPTPQTEVCHDSIGVPEAHVGFYMPDGQTSEGRETWTLVQNPNTTDVTVEISYLTPTGEGNVVWQEVIPAGSRRTFSMADKGINGRAAVSVVSKTTGKKIIVERAMYWNNKGAGTDTIGAFFN